MDGKDGSELGRFLRARREQVSPEEAGIATGPGWRRTPGLRREELGRRPTVPTTSANDNTMF